MAIVTTKEMFRKAYDGKTPEELLDELGLTMQELSNYDCVILGREVRAIPKKNTI